MLRILLIRPGATSYDDQGRVQGTLDIPLSSQGEQQVMRLAEQLSAERPEVLYHCPCQAAVQTAAQLAAKLGLKVKRLDQMENLDHGLWQGMLVSDIRHRHPRVYRQWQEQPDNVCPPEGEMLGEARDRIRETLKKLAKKHKTGCLALVVPEPLASLVVAELTGGDVGDLWKACERTGSWQALDWPSAALATG